MTRRKKHNPLKRLITMSRCAVQDLIQKATAKTGPDCLKDVAWIALPVPPKFISEAEDEKLIEQILGLME